MLPSDGRFGCGPSKVRADQVFALAKANSNLFGTSHRQPPVKKLVGSIRDGLTSSSGCQRLGDSVRQRWGNIFWDAATFGLIRERSQHYGVRRVLLQVRRGDSRGAAPRRIGRHQCEPGAHPTIEATDDGIDHGRTDAQRDLHRRGDAPPPTGGWCARRRRRHVRRGRLGLGARRGRRVLLLAAEVLRRRWRAVVRRVLASRRRAHSRDRCTATGGGPPRWIWPRARQLGCEPDLQHASTRHAHPSATSRSSGCSAMAASTGASSAPAPPPRNLYSWAEASSLRQPVRDRPDAALVRGRHHRPRRFRTGARRQRCATREPHRRHRELSQAGPQPAAGRYVPCRGTRRRGPA